MAFMFTVCFLNLFQYAKLCDLTQNEGTSGPVPDFLFELEYCDQVNARFEKMREGRDLFYAFHGSRLENFHSIIHNGLHCHLNKVGEVITGSFLLCPEIVCFFMEEYTKIVPFWTVIMQYNTNYIREGLYSVVAA